jgi:hypothetical protein
MKSNIQELYSEITSFAQLQDADNTGNLKEIQSIKLIKLEKSQFEILLGYFKKMPHLQSLNLSKSDIGYAEATQIAKALKGMQYFQSLDLSETKIEDLGAIAICDALKYNKQLKSLNLSGNKISPLIIDEIATDFSILKGNLSLDYMKPNIEEPYAEITSMQQWIEADKSGILGEIKAVKLVLDGNHDIRHVLHLLSLMKNLQSADFSDSLMNYDTAIEIARALKRAHNLQFLDLSNNKINDLQAIKITQVLKEIPNVKYNFSTNYIESQESYEEVTSMQEWIRASEFGCLNKIKSLKLKISSTTESIKLISVLPEAKNLQSLKLELEGIFKNVTIGTIQALKKLQSLQSLHLVSNNIGDAVAKELAEVLKGLTNLQSLNLENHKIDEEGAIEIAQALKGLKSFQSLNLGNNFFITEGAAKKLAQIALKKEGPGFVELLKILKSGIESDKIVQDLSKLIKTYTIATQALDLDTIQGRDGINSDSDIQSLIEQWHSDIATKCIGEMGIVDEF